MATVYGEDDLKVRRGRAAYAASEARKCCFTMQERALLERVRSVVKLTLDLDDEDIHTNFYTNEMAVKIQLIPTRYKTSAFDECCSIINEICGVSPHVGDTKDVRIFTIPKLKKYT